MMLFSCETLGTQQENQDTAQDPACKNPAVLLLLNGNAAGKPGYCPGPCLQKSCSITAAKWEAYFWPLYDLSGGLDSQWSMQCDLQ